MTAPPPDIPADQWRRWFDAAGDAETDRALRAIYDELQREITERKPVCEMSGSCCRFNTYDHLLYVTGLEIAWMVRQLDGPARRRLALADLPGMDGCPFQVDRLCSVHALRPLGCRVYFCDPTAQIWHVHQYETMLKRLRALHERLDLPYLYIEYREILDAVRSVENTLSVHTINSRAPS